MNAPHPLPAEGGSYIRNADGSLTRIDAAPSPDALVPEPVAATETPDTPKAAKPAKATVKGE